MFGLENVWIRPEVWGMVRRSLAIFVFALSFAGATVNVAQRQISQAQQAPSTMTVDAQQALVKQYCAGCHNQNLKSGGMSLTDLDLAHVENNPELAEKVIKKLRVGLMPPSGRPRPDAATMKNFATALETTLDRAAALNPNPGFRPFQRLTRTEYALSVRDLLGIDVDVAALLPPDTLSDGFDNIADSQAFSATLSEGYLRAAAKVSRDALGDPKAQPTSAIYKLPRTASQMRHVDGAPMGTRGGISVVYNFPADGEYNFRSLFHGTAEGALFGWIDGEQFEVSIDGQRITLQNIDPKMSETQGTGLNLATGRVFVKAGAHRVSAAFIQKHSGVIDDNITPIEHTLADVDIGDYRELTIFPHLREFEISGPYNATGVSETESRQKVFVCRPLTPADELPCATRIMTALAGRAYRRPASPEDLEGLMSFYDKGRKAGNFESGIRMSLQALLASPKFVFRFERAPASVKPGQTYRVSDVDLASRLSYFLWNTMPDQQLINFAGQGKLSDPIVLEKQVRRMLADPKSEALASKFGGQWLHLPDLESIHPDAFYYPEYDHTLAMALKRETELFFDSIVREDRSVLDLITSNQTFVNERLAKHYGIPNILGNQFRRVELSDDNRRGLLGKGAILTLTSVAERTSPVQRGKWVMVVLFGTPPPPPPPVVPKLEETSATSGGKSLTVRERMEAHRANPSCNSCHQMIDPIGLALENFDVTGAWRTLDRTASIADNGTRVRSPGVAIDTRAKMYDGAVVDGPATLRQAILNHSDAVVLNFTEKLLEYAVGRRVEYFDMPTIRRIARNAAKDNNRLSSLVLGIVKSSAFQMSKAEAPTTAAGK
jgi:mono/diheme cytochrome c family protein